ncbi:anti-sigma-I factor RsgI family protein [Metabacillus sp. HB246100]
MKRGVVVEKNDDFVTLLTPDGQFLKAKNTNELYELGEEISFLPHLSEREEAGTREDQAKRKLTDIFQLKKVRIGALSAFAIMFLFISFLPFLTQDKVYAYMSIDINPSFEIEIDDHLKVTELEPINEEAIKLVTQLTEWKQKPFKEVVNQIITESKREGYVYPGKEIVIATVMKKEDEQIESKLEEDLNQIRDSYKKDEMVVKTIEATDETRDKAKRQGISTGKYLELKKDEESESDEKTQPILDEKDEGQTDEVLVPKATSTNLIEKTPTTIDPDTKSDWENSAKEKLNDTKKQLQDAKGSIQKKSENKTIIKIEKLQEKDEVKQEKQQKKEIKNQRKQERQIKKREDQVEKKQKTIQKKLEKQQEQIEKKQDKYDRNRND